MSLKKEREPQMQVDQEDQVYNNEQNFEMVYQPEVK